MFDIDAHHAKKDTVSSETGDPVVSGKLFLPARK